MNNKKRENRELIKFNSLYHLASFKLINSFPYSRYTELQNGSFLCGYCCFTYFEFKLIYPAPDFNFPTPLDSSITVNTSPFLTVPTTLELTSTFCQIFTVSQIISTKNDLVDIGVVIEDDTFSTASSHTQDTISDNNNLFPSTLATS